MIKYEKKSYQIHDKVVEYIEATFDDSNVILSIPIDTANSDYQEYLNPSEAKTK